MKRVFFLILIFLVSAVGAAAQFSRTDNIVEARLMMLQKVVAPLYRKPTKKEWKTVEPSPALSERYAGFLNQPDTGLTKLINNQGCAENTKVVVATERCLRYTMPGAGSSYSFRTETYRLSRLSDITFTDNSFQAEGIMLHGIFVNLGDMPLERVSLETAGVKYLTDLQPETNFAKAQEFDSRLAEGIEENGFLYRRALFAVENTTFALRSIAYNGKYLRSAKGLVYNELNYDKRKDVIVVFRIVEKDEEGNVTILWKELQQKDAPELKRDDSKTSKDVS